MTRTNDRDYRLGQPSLFVAGLFLFVGAGGFDALARAAETLGPPEVARMQYVSSAQMAPDGGHIAFIRAVPFDPFAEPGKTEPEYENRAPRNELHLIRLADGAELPYITYDTSFSGLAWMPDASGLSFTAKRGKDKENGLYVLPLAGGEARRVLAHEDGIGLYRWSHDGKRVAFLVKDEEPKKKKDLGKKGLNPEIYEEEPLFNRLYIGQPGETENSRKIELTGHVDAFEWAPDNRRLAIAVAPSPLIDDTMMFSRLRIIDVQTGETLTEIANAGKLGSFRWSPDGSRIAFLSGEDIHDPSEGRLMVASAESGEFRDVLPQFEAHVTSIAWQDDDTIMYVADRGCFTEFGKVDANGENKKVLLEPNGPILGGLSLSRDGQRAAFVGESPEHPREVFFMQHGDNSARRMTNVNPWLSDYRLARQEVIRYEARDGLEIEAILIRPLDQEAGKRYPLIISVHGGPEACEQNGWLTNYSRPGQVAAARGFAVLYPNYRGSTGRGVAFSKLDQADYAGPEFDDLVDGARHLVDQGLIDEKRIGVTGGSYGGFASAWCATALTEHFAASVMFVGISDHISKAGTTDIPNEMHLVHSRHWPWESEERWDWFRDRSPIFHAAKCRTPILILHGKEDSRVHPTQSMELHRYLKTMGKVPVRLVLYPGEGHGNRLPGSRLDYHIRMLRWFEHYLAEGDRTKSPPSIDVEYGLPNAKKSKSPESD